MDLRTLTVLVVVVGTAYADDSNDETEMKLSSLNERVATLELKQKDIYDNLFAFREELERRRPNGMWEMQTYPPTTTEPPPTTTTPYIPTTTPRHIPMFPRIRGVRSLISRDCEGWIDKGYSFEGVYPIKPDPTTNHKVKVFCHDKGWTVIQKRTENSDINYATSLDEYSRGFGSVDGDHWLGLNHVHAMTATGNWTLRIRLESFDNQVVSVDYSGFSIGPGPDFVLNFDPEGFEGSMAGDSLGVRHHGRNYANVRGMKFTTNDSDQDNFADGNCAILNGEGGWWYNNCNSASTTGMGDKKIFWYTWRGEENLKRVTMSIKKN